MLRFHRSSAGLKIPICTSGRLRDVYAFDQIRRRHSGSRYAGDEVLSQEEKGELRPAADLREKGCMVQRHHMERMEGDWAGSIICRFLVHFFQRASDCDAPYVTFRYLMFCVTCVTTPVGKYETKGAIGQQADSKKENQSRTVFGTSSRDQTVKLGCEEELLKTIAYGRASPGPCTYNATSGHGKQVRQGCHSQGSMS